MVPIAFYAACAASAIGLGMLLSGATRAVRNTGAVLAFLGAAGVMAEAARGHAPWPAAAMAVVGFVALAGVRGVLATTRPVFAALFFILVILSGAAAAILLEAEFLAFALIIVYAGAILITYLFVLMLAQQEGASEILEYDRSPRDPIAAVLVGMVLLAVLGSAIFDFPRVGAGSPAEATLSLRRQWHDLASMPRLLQAEVSELAPGATVAGKGLSVGPGGASVGIREGESTRELALPESALPDNTRRVGVSLVEDFPVSLELAGVILTMALLGAVLLARRQAEIAAGRVGREGAGQ